VVLLVDTAAELRLRSANATDYDSVENRSVPGMRSFFRMPMLCGAVHGGFPEGL
jgi:hypothetical protein